MAAVLAAALLADPVVREVREAISTPPSSVNA